MAHLIYSLLLGLLLPAALFAFRRGYTEADEEDLGEDEDAEMAENDQ